MTNDSLECEVCMLLSVLVSLQGERAFERESSRASERASEEGRRGGVSAQLDVGRTTGMLGEEEHASAVKPVGNGSINELVGVGNGSINKMLRIRAKKLHAYTLIPHS